MSRDFIYKENDNIYLNVVFSPPVLTMTSNPATPHIGNSSIPMEYSVNKTLAIVDKCSDYYCSVIRFDIPLNAIPIFIVDIIPPEDQIGPFNPNLTPYIIGIRYNGIFYSSYLIFTSETSSQPPVYGQETNSNYYYVFTYNTLISMVNVTLLQAFTNSGLAALFPTVIPPYFFFDSATQLVSLVVPSLFTILTAPAVEIPLIFQNEELLRFLNSFVVFLNGDNQPNGASYYFQLTNTTPLNPSILIPPPRIYPQLNQAYNPNDAAPTTPPSYFIYTEEFSTIQYWSSLRKIIISTNTIPINNEYIPAIDNGSGVATSFPILTDYVIPLQNGADTKSIAYYYPSAQYRLVDMMSDTPLYKINLKVYWEDTLGALHPLLISINQNASVKIGFFRKTLYKGTKLIK